MRKFIFHISLLLLVIFGITCVERYYPEDNDMKTGTLVINAHLTNVPGEQVIEISRSVGLNYPSFDPVSGSFAEVIREDGEFKEFSEFKPGYYMANLDDSASRSYIHTEATEFGDMALAEVSRGCSRGCRFCAAGYIYLPPRERSLDNLLDQVDSGLCQRQKIGLVGAAVADHTQFKPLQQGILERGGQVSVSSLRLDALTVEEVSGLRASGLRTAAIAPEAGSQRMRDLINKGLDEDQILHAVQLLADGDIINLKLYFLIGLPTETQEDLVELLQLAEKIRLLWREVGRKRGQMGTLTLSVNPFIPKPFTPLQWAGMEGEKSLKKKIRFLRSAVARMPNTELNTESIRAAVLQAFLSRGDRRIGRLLPALAEGGNLKQLCRKAGLELDFYVSRQRQQDEIFPWEIIDQGVRRDYFWQEYQRALQGQFTPRCSSGCQRCGVCG